MTATMTFEDAEQAAMLDAEDAAAFIPEPTHSADEEAEYIDYVLPGYCEQREDEGDYLTDEFLDEWDSRLAGDRWERAFWGD